LIRQGGEAKKQFQNVELYLLWLPATISSLQKPLQSS
jgi:hypothetical protein